MINNFIRLAYRHLLKNQIFSAINIVGLAVGITAFLYISRYVQFERSYENFHVNAENIYRVTLELYKGNEYEETDCETYGPVGPTLKDRFAEVQEFVRMFHYGQQEVQSRDRRFLEDRVYFADSTFFDVFTSQVIHGNAATALVEPFQAVVTQSVAEKYFGKTDCIGEEIRMDGDKYEITAVIADLPPNTHLKSDFLLSHITISKTWPWYERNEWNANNEYTYLLMTPGVDLDEFNKKLTDFSLEMKERIGEERFIAEPITRIHLHSNKSFEPEANGDASVVYFLMIIGGVIIAIAWVNYVNLATARAVERAREVGIRKVMGSHRAQLIIQFLSESAIINLLAGVIALIFYQTALPIFNKLTGQPVGAMSAHDPDFWWMFSGILVIGTLTAGLYPAFVLSSFQPAYVLKGKFRSSAHGRQLRRALVLFQFSVTVVLLVCVITVFLQLRFLQNYDLGMKLDQTIVLHAPGTDARDESFGGREETFKKKLLEHTAIHRVAFSACVPGVSIHEMSTTGIRRYGEETKEGSYNFYFYNIDANFIPTFGMELVAGRNFEAGASNDDQVIINEESVAKLGFASPEEAIGEKVNFISRNGGEFSTIIGVVKNFNQRSPKEQHLPMFFYFRPSGGYYAVRVNTGNVHETLAMIKETWESTFPNSLFDYFFMDENYQRQYQADAQFGKVMASFSVLAVLIACLGLFGLSSFTIVQRTKEIGIRKVLGASVAHIVTLLTRDFMGIILLSSLLALPVAWWAMDQWLLQFAVRITLNPWMFAVPVLVILVIALVTVGFQTFRSAIANPTDSLRQE